MTVEAITGNEFIDGLLDRLPAQAVQPKRGQNYNYPERLFLKPDGMVVSLQGDPQNLAYYVDKGYHLLSRAPGRDGKLSEVDQYQQVEYPRILADQRQRAEIINAIRKAAERDPTFFIADEFDNWTVEDLKAYVQQIKEETGKDIRVVSPRGRRARQAAEEVAAQRELEGVETAETRSLEDLNAMLTNPIAQKGPRRG
jgi:hypothetical protein